jgi:hypothetical protein
MDMKKPCVVTDIGWFSEWPDNCVIKMPINCLVDDLFLLFEKIEDSNFEDMVNNAKNYVEEYCLPEVIAEKIYGILNK